MHRLFIFLLILFYLPVYGQEKRLYLDNWYFINSSGPKMKKGYVYPDTLGLNSIYALGDDEHVQLYKATVPGVVHTDLAQIAGYPDFYAGDSENSAMARWVENENWIYTTAFNWSCKHCDEEDLDQPILPTELVFEGLDTYANVWLNDSLILEADNMFRTWVIPVNGILRNGHNELRVAFTSPLNYHRETLKNAPYELPSGNETVKNKVSTYTRKAAYQFGWDFAPRFVTCGIWRPCYLRTVEHFAVSDFYARTLSVDEENTARLEIELTIESDSTYPQPYQIDFLDQRDFILLKKGKQQVTIYRSIEEADPWYPNGMGKPSLYHPVLQLINPAGNSVFEKETTVAIRQIELVNEPDSIGTSFYFKVNGQPVFIKGANYVPQDVFLPSVSDQETTDLLTKVKDANMNMIRVWGGGIYESDHFYQTCDALGIMVWQDFMFANSMYPATKAFHENVAAEIEDNVKRLRNHPCIALWCGNNEIEVAWHNWGWQKQFGYSEKDSAEIWDNYRFIFHELIPETLRKYDARRPYISSSPQSNWGKKENFNHGAMHYWGVWHGREPMDSFKTNVARFMVEYGFQSYPDPYTLQIVLRDQLHRDSAAFKNRQKSYIGDVLIKKEIENYFGDLSSLEDWLLASQHIQAEAYKTAIQAHRINAPHCMGTLLWQLNDCWPGPSWSIIDYYGKPKLAYESVVVNYAPAIAVVDTSGRRLSITVQSESPIEKGLIVLNPCTINTYIPKKTLIFKFSTAAFSPVEVVSMKLDRYRKKYPLSEWDLYISVQDEKTGDWLYEDIHYFRKVKLEEIRQ